MRSSCCSILKDVPLLSIYYAMLQEGAWCLLWGLLCDCSSSAPQLEKSACMMEVYEGPRRGVFCKEHAEF